MMFAASRPLDRDDGDVMSQSKAEELLMSELQYSKERARFIVRQFDKNGDGKLSAKEMERFKDSVKQTKNELRAAFKSYDVDKKGFISYDDAKKFLRRQPFNFSAKKIEALLHTFDRNRDGAIDFNEFVTFYPEAKAIQKQIMEFFDKLDTSRHGFLTVDQLLGPIMQMTGFDEPGARQFIETLDFNEDGCIDKHEFMDMWTLMFE